MQPVRLLALLLVSLVVSSGCLSSKPDVQEKADKTPVVVPPRPASEWKELLSKPRFTGIVSSTGVAVAKDGTELAIDLYQPAGIGAEKMPTFLVLSPYWAFNGYLKETQKVTGASIGWFTSYFTSRGYTVALADMRGTRNSSGCFDFGGAGDQQDGYAIVEWLGTRPWSNGKVGMYGVSHVGMSQVAAAVANPPHLTTIMPIAAIHSFYRYLYFGGTHYDLNMFTPPAYTAVATLPPLDPTGSPTTFAKALADTGCKAAEYNVKGTSQDGRFDAFWRERDYPDKAANVNTSIFFIHGFIDHNVKFDHVDAMWRAMAARENGPFIKAHFGQWGHQEPTNPDWRLITHRWMDHWLLGIDTGMLQEPRVTIQTSDRSWRNETQWPATEGERVLYFAAGKLQDAPGTGSASFQDVPQRGRGREQAGEFLLFESDAFTENVHVSGIPVVSLQAASDKASTHFAVLAYDVSPSGQARLWNRGYLDSKQRNGLEKDEPLSPGQQARFNVSLFPDDYILASGHKLRLVVKSSDACGYVVEAIAFQCGPTGVVSDTTLAKNTVFFGESRFILPTTDGIGATR